MSALLQNLLISHVIFGLLGIIAFYGVWMGLMKRVISLKFLRQFSFLGFIFLMLSWLTGGYYYVIYYGKAVKPVIKSGQFPWAHLIFMEAKEHIFLFLPFLSLVTFAVLMFLGRRLEKNPALKRSLIWLAGVIVVLGIVITLSGMIISGAVK